MATTERAAAILENLAFTHFTIGNIAEATEAFDRMLQVARALGDERMECRAVARCGFAQLIAHEFEASERLLRDAMALAIDPSELYLPTLMLALQLFITDRRDEGLVHLASAREMAYVVDDPLAAGFWDEAAVIVPNWEARYDEALEQAREGRVGPADSLDQFSAVANLGGSWAEGLALCGAGRYDEALATFHQVLAKAERIGDVFYRLRTLNSIGWVYMELGDFDRGWEWNMRALDVAQELGMLDPEIDSNAHLNLGDVLVARDELDAAEEQFKKVEAIFRNPAPADHWMLWRYSQHLLHSYGELHLKRGNTEKSLEFGRECLAMAERSSARKNVIKARRLIGETLAANGDLEAAAVELQEALAVARTVGNPTQLWKTLAALGEFDEANAVIERIAASLSDDAMRETFLGSRYVSEVRAKAR